MKTDKTKIGVTANGVDVRISEGAPNGHISIYGLTGTGKSTKSREICWNRVEDGETVISYELENSNIPVHSDWVNIIDAQKDGIDMNLLDSSSIDRGEESYVNYIQYAVDTLAGTHHLGVRQVGCVREAIEFAMKHRDEYDNDMEAIAEMLFKQKSSSAEGVYNKLWPVLRSDIFRKSEKHIIPGKWNIIVLAGLASTIQKAVMEIMLHMLWHDIRLHKNPEEKVTIVIDEFQKLSLKKESVLMDMLRESRQHGVKLLLATQSSDAISTEVSSAINQTATTLFFQPHKKEIVKVANLIDPVQSNRYTLMLNKLAIGQCIATGKFQIGNYTVDKPVLLCSGVKKNVISPLLLEKCN